MSMSKLDLVAKAIAYVELTEPERLTRRWPHDFAPKQRLKYRLMAIAAVEALGGYESCLTRPPNNTCGD